MKRKSFVTLFCIGLMVSLCCGIALAEKPIVIGAPMPLTGPFASSGEQMKMALDLGVEELNAAGGLFGRKLKVVYGDVANVGVEDVKSVGENEMTDGALTYWLSGVVLEHGVEGIDAAGEETGCDTVARLMRCHGLWLDRDAFKARIPAMHDRHEVIGGLNQLGGGGRINAKRPPQTHGGPQQQSNPGISRVGKVVEAVGRIAHPQLSAVQVRIRTLDAGRQPASFIRSRAGNVRYADHWELL